jgi:hypothetical protein
LLSHRSVMVTGRSLRRTNSFEVVSHDKRSDARRPRPVVADVGQTAHAMCIKNMDLVPSHVRDANHPVNPRTRYSMVCHIPAPSR